jgi:hypothetical protein
MPVSSFHPLYSEFYPKWERIRDVIAGEDKIKAQGEKYLPKLSGQTDDEFNAYKLRAEFFNATGRTQGGLLGLIFEKDPTVTVPAECEEWLNDITLTGTTFFGFAKHVTEQIVGPGRFGIYVDFDQDAGRSYFVGYMTEQIINWRTERKKGKQFVTMVVLKESVESVQADQFVAEVKERYRVLLLEDGVFKVRLYEKKQPSELPKQGTEPTKRARTAQKARTGNDDELMKEFAKAAKKPDEVPEEGDFTITEIVPVIRGTALKFIPFTFVGVTRNEAEPERPPLEDVATVNLSHYRTSADLEHGRHFTGLPTAWVAGFDTDEELRIGAATAWISKDPTAKAGFLEFTGQGLQALEKAVEQKETRMAVLGARLLEQQKKEAETAETLRLRQAGESSVLASIATTVGEALTAALRFLDYWRTGGAELETDPEKISAELNTNFIEVTLTPQAITALVSAWQGKAISHLTLLHNFQKTGILPPEIDPEDEQARIDDEAPALSGDPLDLDPDTGEVPGTARDAQAAAAKKKAADDEEAKKNAAAELKVKQQQAQAKARAGKK